MTVTKERRGAERTASHRGEAALVLRQLAVTTLAGALVGLLVAGVGGRLAMMLLAVLNPEFAGARSDDGFEMGRLTLATVNLLLLTTGLGGVCGGLYLVLRRLLIGPRWFQVASLSGGVAVVAGAGLVHVDGVDFQLDPAWLAVGLFVAIPAVSAAALTILAERWLRPGSWAMRVGLGWMLVPLLLWIPAAPLLGGLLAVLAALHWAGRSRHAALHHPAWPWAGRTALAALFAVALADLLRDVEALT